MDISEKFTKAPQLLLQEKRRKIKLNFTKLRFLGEDLSQRQLIFQDLLFSKLLSGSIKTLNPTYVLRVWIDTTSHPLSYNYKLDVICGATHIDIESDNRN